VHQLPGYTEHPADLTPREADGPGGAHSIRVSEASAIEIIARPAELSPAGASHHFCELRQSRLRRPASAPPTRATCRPPLVPRWSWDRGPTMLACGLRRSTCLLW